LIAGALRAGEAALLPGSQVFTNALGVVCFECSTQTSPTQKLSSELDEANAFGETHAFSGASTAGAHRVGEAAILSGSQASTKALVVVCFKWFTQTSTTSTFSIEIDVIHNFCETHALSVASTAGAVRVGEAARLTGPQVAGESKANSPSPGLGGSIMRFTASQVSLTLRLLSL
jgi:uncharacterized membrane protein